MYDVMGAVYEQPINHMKAVLDVMSHCVGCVSADNKPALEYGDFYLMHKNAISGLPCSYNR